MSLTVSPITFTSSAQSNDNRSSNTEKAAAGVGVAGATTSYASRTVNKKGVLANFTKAGRNINQLTKEANDALISARKAKTATEQMTNLFKAKRLSFTADAMKFFDKVKNWKFVGKIANSPVLKKVSGAFGTTMAFFVLVPSVLNMINVAGDIKNS